MKPKGILFSAPMVKAILAGTKNQTRRIVKCDWLPGPDALGYLMGEDVTRFAPETGHSSEAAPYPVGSILYVKETHYRWGKWVKSGLTKKGRRAWRFKADGIGLRFPGYGPTPPSAKRTAIGWHKRPSIFMPRVAARLWLEVTGMRVERLREISVADVLAEGCILSTSKTEPLDYQNLWESINGKGSWEANPFVWVYTFRRIERPKV